MTKKIAILVLALVMILPLSPVSASAASTSVTQLTHVQALFPLDFSEREEVKEVTLISGDKVIVFTAPDGEKQYIFYPAARESYQGYHTLRKGGYTYIVPGGVDLSRFDLELFNIDYLLQQEYTNNKQLN